MNQIPYETHAIIQYVESYKSLSTSCLSFFCEKSNIEKDTEKKGVEIGNINQDTAVKVAQEKLTNSQTDKVKEETRQTTYLIDKYLPKQYDEIVKRIDKMSADITNSNQLTKAQVALFNKQISEIMSIF